MEEIAGRKQKGKRNTFVMRHVTHRMCHVTVTFSEKTGSELVPASCNSYRWIGLKSGWGINTGPFLPNGSLYVMIQMSRNDLPEEEWWFINRSLLRIVSNGRGKGTMKKLLLICAAVLFAFGCIRTIPTEKVEQFIIEGKTTKAEVVERLGRPDLKYKTPGMTINSGDKTVVLHQPVETWVYLKNIFEVLDLSEETYLKVNFNKDGIVTSYDVMNEE